MNSKIKNLCLLFITLVAISFLTSCASALDNANKEFQKGNYLKALKYSENALYEDKSSQDAQTIFLQSWKYVATDMEKEIDDLLAQNTIESLQIVQNKYIIYINEARKAINLYIKDTYPVPDLDELEKERIAAANLLNEKYINLGKEHLEKNNSEDAKIAYSYFNKAKENKSNYENLDQLINDAKEKATIVIYITAADDDGYTSLGGHPKESISLIRPIYEILDKNEFVNVIYDKLVLDSDYNDNDRAKAHAKKVGATHLLQFKPNTQYNYNKDFNRSKFLNTDWDQEVLTISSEIKIDFIYKLIDLSNDKIIKEGSYSYSDSNDDDFKMVGVLSQNNKVVIDYGVGEFTGNKEIRTHKLTNYDSCFSLYHAMKSIGIELEYSDCVNTLNVLPLSINNSQYFEKQDYKLLKDANKIDGFKNHVFFNFDAVETVDSVDNNYKNYTFMYTNYFKQNTGNMIDDYLKTAAVDSSNYDRIRRWACSEETKKALFYDLIENSYLIDAPKAFATNLSEIL